MTMNEISTMATYATSVMTHKAYEIAVVYKQLAEDGKVTENTSKFYDQDLKICKQCFGKVENAISERPEQYA